MSEDQPRQPRPAERRRSSGSLLPSQLSAYVVGKTIGRGAYGKVKVAVHTPTQQKVAIKIVDKAAFKSADDASRSAREVRLLQTLRHPHVIGVTEVFELEQKLYIVMEFCSGGELFEYIVQKGRLTEEKARHFFRQILSAMFYCHKNFVVHRDLKPENILLDHMGELRIADFGFTNTFSKEKAMSTYCGSPQYASPEMVNGWPYEGPHVDVWSLGVILFAMVCGTLPFPNENLQKMFDLITDAQFNMPDSLSAGLKDLISSMLRKRGPERITVEAALNHPWVTNQGVMPPPVTYMPPHDSAADAQTDRIIQRKMLQLGFNVTELPQMLASKVDNAITAVYYIFKAQVTPAALPAGTGPASGGNPTATGAPSAPSTPVPMRAKRGSLPALPIAQKPSQPQMAATQMTALGVVATPLAPAVSPAALDVSTSPARPNNIHIPPRSPQFLEESLPTMNTTMGGTPVASGRPPRAPRAGTPSAATLTPTQGRPPKSGGSSSGRSQSRPTTPKIPYDSDSTLDAADGDSQDMSLPLHSPNSDDHLDATATLDSSQTRTPSRVSILPSLNTAAPSGPTVLPTPPPTAPSSGASSNLFSPGTARPPQKSSGPSPAPRQRRTSVDPALLEQVAAKVATQQPTATGSAQLREMAIARPLLGPQYTSSATPDVILAEVTRAAQAAGLATTQECFHVEATGLVAGREWVTMQIEVCQIANLPGLHTLRVRRVEGEIFSYKNLSASVMAGIKL